MKDLIQAQLTHDFCEFHKELLQKEKYQILEEAYKEVCYKILEEEFCEKTSLSEEDLIDISINSNLLESLYDIWLKVDSNDLSTMIKAIDERILYRRYGAI